MTRHYGLEIGDKVLVHISGVDEICTVLKFDPTDNNKCLLEGQDGIPFVHICEWCRKLDKI